MNESQMERGSIRAYTTEPYHQIQNDKLLPKAPTFQNLKKKKKS